MKTQRQKKAPQNKVPVSQTADGQSFTTILGSLSHRIMYFDTVAIFIIFYLIYNTIDGVGLMSGDTTPASLLPIALITNHNVYLDFATIYATSPDFSYAFPFVQGHYVSLFPIVTPVLVTPMYLISAILSLFISNPLYGDNLLFFLSKSAASYIAALAGVLIYLSGKELFSRRIAVLTAFIFAFATSTWSISSQALWQHGTVELLLAALIYLIIKTEKNQSQAYIVLMGILSGLFVFNRPPDSLLLLPILFYIVWYQRSRIHYFITGGIVGGFPFFYYNYTVFGNIFGGYIENLSRFAIDSGFIGHFVALIIAPNVGLFVYCPVLLLSIAGAYILYSRKEDSCIRTVLLLAGAAILLEILLYSFFGLWSSSAGFCFGPRFLTGLVPILCLYTGYFLEDWFGTKKTDHQAWEKSAVIIIVISLIVASVGIQIIGTFFYLYSSKGNHYMDDERAWNMSDSVIVRSYSEGYSRIPGISMFILPPLPYLFRYDFKRT